MATISNILVSDVSKERSNTFLLANQYDDNSRKYKLVFTNNGVPIPFNTPKIIRVIMKAKGEAEPYIDKILTEPWENNQPVMIFTSGMLSKTGEVEYKFIIYEPNGSEILSTRTQKLKIQETFTNRDGIIQDEDFDFLTQVINEAIAAGSDILRKSELINGFTQTTPGSVALDAASGKTLFESLYFKGITTNINDEINKILTGKIFAYNYEASTVGAPSVLPGNLVTYYLTTINTLQCAVDSDGNCFYRKRTGATISSWSNLNKLSGIGGIDTSGLLGTVGATVESQALIDDIADKVWTKLIPFTNIANNLLATDPKTVLSGPMGKSLKDQIDTTNGNLTTVSNSLVQKGTDIFIRKGNVVEASIINGWLNQRNVPIGYRPAGLRHFLLWDSTTNVVADVYFDETVNKFVSADHNFAGTMVWITTDPMPL